MLTPYLIAWAVAIVAGVGLAGVMVVLTRFIKMPSLRALIVILTPVLFLVPVPVPLYEGNLAPAFMVLLVEGLFQAEGQIEPAVRVLTLAAFAVIGLVVLVFGVAKLRRRTPQ